MSKDYILAISLGIGFCDSFFAAFIFPHIYRVTLLLRVEYFIASSVAVGEAFALIWSKLLSTAILLMTLLVFVFFMTCVGFVLYRSDPALGTYFGNFWEI